MFQNLKQKTRNREDISKLLIRLMYKVALLEKEISEGGNSTVLTLQEVTNEGNTTTNPISVVDELGYGITISQNQIDLSSLSVFQAFQLSGQHLKIGKSFTYLELIAEKLQYSNNFGAKGTLVFPDLGNIGIEETIATQEWISTQLPLTATVEISSAQLLALATTPIELIAAQGAGKYISLENYLYYYGYGTEDYDFDFAPSITGITPRLGEALDVDLSGSVSKVLRQAVINTTLLENTAITLDYDGTAPTQGDGTLKLILTYRIIDI